MWEATQEERRGGERESSEAMRESPLLLCDLHLGLDECRRIVSLLVLSLRQIERILEAQHERPVLGLDGRGDGLLRLQRQLQLLRAGLLLRESGRKRGAAAGKFQKEK